MSEYRKKPVVIEAEKWAGTTTPFAFATVHVFNFQRSGAHPLGLTTCNACGGDMHAKIGNHVLHTHGWIDTLESGHVVCPGDWIIKGVKGEFYPCKPDVFAMTYELADSANVQASEARGDSTDPHPRWDAENPNERHPQAVDGWDWHKDGPENGGGLERSRRRLTVASDLGDPRAPDQMALVLRVDLMRVLGSLIWRESQSECRARQIAELSAHTQAGPVG